jgi:2-deoxy-D-gluconate 3-dehydrogenase
MALPRTPSFRLEGRRALVTGASSGIGLGSAAALAEAGAAVTCVARGADRLAEAVSAIRAAGGTATAVAMDVADTRAVADLFADGAYDCIVNAAGLARHGPALDTAEADFDTVMGVNLRAAYFLSQQAAKALVAAGKPGAIVHIGSQMGHVGGIDRAVYCATKHGVEGMVKAMAVEWGKHGIRINSVCPTFVRTPLTEPTFRDETRLAWLMEKIKLGRVAEVEDIMGAVVFLSSDAGAMITGTHLLIDGGWTAV